jgi:hypothetical protein
MSNRPKSACKKNVKKKKLNMPIFFAILKVCTMIKMVNGK